jgi:hypothetical protein
VSLCFKAALKLCFKAALKLLAGVIAYRCVRSVSVMCARVCLCACMRVRVYTFMSRAAQWKLRNETAEEEGRVSRAPRTRGIWRLELRDWCCVCGLEIGVVCARLLLRLVAACCCSCLRVVCVGVSSLAFAGLAA